MCHCMCIRNICALRSMCFGHRLPKRPAECLYRKRTTLCSSSAVSSLQPGVSCAAGASIVLAIDRCCGKNDILLSKASRALCTLRRRTFLCMSKFMRRMLLDVCPGRLCLQRFGASHEHLCLCIHSIVCAKHTGKWIRSVRRPLRQRLDRQATTVAGRHDNQDFFWTSVTAMRHWSPCGYRPQHICRWGLLPSRQIFFM